MNYYALFLEEENYVEKCLSLMRFISNPLSHSLPHITVRLFKVSDVRIEESKKQKFTHLNILEPGTFNLENKKGPYVVYLRCESEELEGIEYKPDFPYSRLHLTIYEGNDSDYALNLYNLLNQNDWHFKLSFDNQRTLEERKVGVKNHKKPNFEKMFCEIIGERYQDFNNRQDDILYKLRLIKIILEKLKQYLTRERVENVDSLYEPFFGFKNADVESIGQYEFNFNSLEKKESYVINKPVRDAIFITPPEYAKDMAKCGLKAFGDINKKINFGDSAIGTGTLFLALRFLLDEKNREEDEPYEIESAIGIDIDKKMAEEAYIRCKKRGLKVYHKDALSADSVLSEKRNLMLVNPPFNRHEDIPGDYKEAIYQLAKEQTGISISGNASLYTYHLLIMDKWLSEEGIAVWLLPTIFMQSKYGLAIREYLLKNVQLIRIHVYNDELQQFENISIATSIIVFKKCRVDKTKDILFTYGDSVEKPENAYNIKRRELVENMNNWRVLLNYRKELVSYENSVKFGDLFEIKRGIATGANSFFVMSRKKAKEYNIPDIALRPLIPKARHLDSLVIESKEDGYPDVEPQLVVIDCDLEENIIKKRYPDFYNYLQLAKESGDDGTAIIDRTLVRGRRPWYKQERRDTPLFLLTYMGRNKEDLPPLYFIHNKSKAIALNTYLLLYPKSMLSEKLEREPQLCEKLLNILNKSAEIIVSDRSRIYAGGLKKIEPKELCNLPIIGINKILN